MTNDTKKAPVSTEPYKGVRDFYPADMAVENYIFDTWRAVVERYGYTEYSASILEPASLYRTKSGEEIVNEQMYVFEDRGGREVALRPEMTPTVGRMVAAERRQLSFPLRWYSIPNLFRYERPQRGRLREHWQLNVDLFGLEGAEAEAEIITIAYRLLRTFGLTNEQFSLRIHSRILLSALFESINLNTTQEHAVSKLIDRKNKLGPGEFMKDLSALVDAEQASKIDAYMNAVTLEEIPDFLKDTPGEQGMARVCERLVELGVENVVFDPTIVRGFDYYTGTVFEVFDTHPENNRSLFGGGRYDDLLDIFGQEKMPAVGFGMGDVTMRDVLETYKLIPDHVRATKTDLYICILEPTVSARGTQLADTLREGGLRVAVDYTYKKIGDQIRKADKDGVPFILAFGEEEATSRKYKVKNLKDSSEVTLEESAVAEYIKTSRPADK